MGGCRPFFFGARGSPFGVGRRAKRISITVVHGLPQLQALMEQSANGLGYEVVEVERSAQGLLRVSIERAGGEPITVEDCEKLSHQLTHVFAVENVDYARLEVSSPGLDRPLKKLADFARFAGQEATVKLRTMVAGRRTFEGTLVAPQDDQIGIEVEVQGGRSLLKFALADVERARLIPKIDFKRKVR